MILISIYSAVSDFLSQFLSPEPRNLKQMAGCLKFCLLLSPYELNTEGSQWKLLGRVGDRITGCCPGTDCQCQGAGLGDGVAVPVGDDGAGCLCVLDMEGLKECWRAGPSTS